MVSTRRGAQTGVADDHEEASVKALRKKPVRSTTAKTAASTAKATAAKAPVPKARATRAKKTEPSTGNLAKEQSEDDELEPEPAKATRSTKSTATRTKKEALPAPQRKEQVSKSQSALPSRRGRAKKDEAPDGQAPDLKPPAAVAAKQTRTTRAVAAKPAPLSPKKITQVSSRPTSRDTDDKPEKKAVAAKKGRVPASAVPATHMRGNGRKRGESDENAGVDTAQEKAEERESVSSSVLGQPSPRKTRSTRSRGMTNSTAVDETQDVSTAEISHDTPSASTEDEREEVVEDRDSTLHSTAGTELSNDELGNDYESEDEICGAKTPMKRSPFKRPAKFQKSMQKTVLPIQLSSKRPTAGAKTPIMLTEADLIEPESDAESTIVALPLPTSESLDESTMIEEPTLDMEEQEESSLIEQPALSVVQNESSEYMSEQEIDSDDYTMMSRVGPSDDGEDETVLVEQDAYCEQSDQAFTEPDADMTELEDTVIVSRDEDTSSDDDELEDSFDFDRSQHDISTFESRSLETIQWNNLRDDVTIPVNFEAHFSKMHSLPQTTPTERLSINADTFFSFSASGNRAQSSEPGAQAFEEHRAEDDEDMTLHVSEFIDTDALSGALDSPQKADVVLPPSAASPSKSVDEDTMDVTGLVNEADATPAKHSFGQNMDVTGILHDEMLPGSPSKSIIGEDMDITGLVADAESDESSSATPPPAYETIQPAGAESAEHDIEDTVVEVDYVPHYARPTFAFDARRKSLPAFGHQTPLKSGTRPNTSDGGSLPRSSANWEEPWWLRSRREAKAAAPVQTTPSRSRPSTSGGAMNSSKPATPARSVFAPSAAGTPATAVQERFPKLRPRNEYSEHAQTVAPATRFHTPEKGRLNWPATVAKAAKGRMLSSINIPASARRSTTPSKQHASPSMSMTPKAATPLSAARQATTQKAPAERFPRLGARNNYDEHALTVAAPARFRTPTQQTPAKRSMTVQRVSLKDSTPRRSRTPVKTPLKAAAMTPSQVPLTPHPAAPLRGVLALVEVYTNEGASASAPFIQLLNRLGAKTTKVFSDRVTHVVFKGGSPTTLQRVRLHNKEVEESGKGLRIECVNSRWVSDCDSESACVDESGEQYAVDVEEVPRGGKRRRKSMEPSALQNVNGNIIRDRKSSGRFSIGRSSSGARSSLSRATFESPAKCPSAAKKLKLSDVENSPELCNENSILVGGDFAAAGEDSAGSSPATPAYLAAPDTLVQQTAPQNRVRKLQVKGGGKSDRRLTFLNGPF